MAGAADGSVTVKQADPERAAEIQAKCKTWLPVYMLPTACVALPTLPMSTHGKLDRAQLPPPVRAARRPTKNLTGELLPHHKHYLHTIISASCLSAACPPA